MAFVRELMEKGRESGLAWLKRHRADVGVRSGFKV
jgi:NTE family protein